MSVEEDNDDVIGEEENPEESEKELKILKERKNWIQITSEDLNFDISTALEDASGKPIESRRQLDDRLKLLALTIKKFIDNQKVLRRTVYQYFVMIREAAEKLGYTGPQIRKIAEEIFREYGISEGHIRRVIPYELKHHQHTNIRYRKRGELQQQQTTTGQPELTDEQLEEEFMSEGTPTQALPSNLQQQGQTTFEATTATDLSKDTAFQLRNALTYIKQCEAKIRQLEDQLSNSIIIGQETRVYSGHVPLDNENQLPIRVAINLKENRIEYLEIDTESMRKTAEETVET